MVKKKTSKVEQEVVAEQKTVEAISGSAPESHEMVPMPSSGKPDSLDPLILEKLLTKGDLSGLSVVERNKYLFSLAQTLGLNPLTRPFDIIQTADGKLIPYANKGCAEQLRGIYKISLTKIGERILNDIFLVDVIAETASGRKDFATGAVSIKNLQGEALSNAYMKSETKAKRRATFSILGLNMLDETEASSIPNAKPVITAAQQIVPKWTSPVEKAAATQVEMISYLPSIGITPPTAAVPLIAANPTPKNWQEVQAGLEQIQAVPPSVPPVKVPKAKPMVKAKA